jgi:hypothetical protein
MATWRLVMLDRRIITQKLRAEFKQVNNPTTMIAIHNTLAKRCDPYVPFLNGPLSQTNQVSAEGVRYIQPYARYQYYGTDFNHTLDYHPLASAMWDKAMLRDHRDEFNREVEDIIRWRLKRANG